MSKRHFSYLLLVAIVVTIAVLLVPSKTGRQAEHEAGPFLPQLAERINDISVVRLSTMGGAEVVTLERVNSAWVVQESSAYPADWSVLKPLLADLSQAVVVEVKTSNPEYYHRLGVEDPDLEDSVSKLIEFPGDESLPGVIVGNSAQGRDGQYLRLQGEARSVLVDRDITLPLNSAAWLSREIVDVADSDVVSVSISHPDGGRVAIERESADVTDFTLLDIPEGREAASAWSVNQLASVLSGLELDGVSPAEEHDWSNAGELQLVTSDGLQVVVLMIEEDENRWIRVEASGSDAADPINERVNGWAYRIPLYKYDAMNKRMDDVLAAVEDDDFS